MFINSKTISLTLVASLLTLASANDFAAPRREHDSLKRLIRKRAPADLLQGLTNNFAPDPNAATNATDPNASASAASNSALPSASDSALPSASDSASLSQSASQSASLSQSSQSSASQSQPASKTKEPEVKPTPDADDDNAPAAGASRSTVTNVASAIVAVETTPPAPQSAAGEQKSTIITIIIVVAASIGGIAILWTVFRKWKLGASKKFDSRMGPIDWQPSNDDDNGIVPAHRLARTNSYASSVHSSSHGHGAGGYRDPLAHDFTAAPSHLAPVGGYADLTRGPSPQPQMQETLSRGPSLTTPNRSYGAAHSGVPLHHQAGYGGADAYDYNGDAVRF
jgi:hypothetical protein